MANTCYMRCCSATAGRCWTSTTVVGFDAVVQPSETAGMAKDTGLAKDMVLCLLSHSCWQSQCYYNMTHLVYHWYCVLVKHWYWYPCSSRTKKKHLLTMLFPLLNTLVWDTYLDCDLGTIVDVSGLRTQGKWFQHWSVNSVGIVSTASWSLTWDTKDGTPEAHLNSLGSSIIRLSASLSATVGKWTNGGLWAVTMSKWCSSTHHLYVHFQKISHRFSRYGNWHKFNLSKRFTVYCWYLREESTIVVHLINI